jgi:hypothetical protein
MGVTFSAGPVTAGQSMQVSEFDLRATPGVSIGLNASPPPCELRNIAFEQDFCQRYYRVSQIFLQASGNAAHDFIGASSPIVPSMRAVPTMTITGNSSSNISSPSLTASINIFIGTGTVTAAGAAAIVFLFTASAEL